MAEASSRNVVLTGAAGGMGGAITGALLESGRPVDRDHVRIAEMMILPVNRY
ncbi:hypothetical protein [Bradyrhizobium icense]|uniref:hypothetical protein n=1 Tax=Bradyrhizobium icense TaxID=1274631 RepID=UPI001F2C0C77|nr:hypothetical protein [Bradyrhizobium icense]